MEKAYSVVLIDERKTIRLVGDTIKMFPHHLLTGHIEGGKLTIELTLEGEVNSLLTIETGGKQEARRLFDDLLKKFPNRWE
jgi:hypothetical protein